MDLIYMNADKEDIGVLHNYEMDLAFGEDENNFECTMSAKNHCCEAGYYLYIEGTEYGGIIDGIKSETGSEDVIYSGRTWHGILGSKIILPLQIGESSTDNVTIRLADSSGNSLVNRYLIVSGDANACLRFVIDRIGVSDMFEVPGNLAGVNINSYQFNRYTDAYMGIRKMLASAGLKMKLAYSNGKVVISAVERYDFSKDDSFDSDLLDLSITKKYKTVNHLICLGKGELENRLVIHLYADAEGNISQEQTQFGLDEYAATYDYSTVESEEELLAKGTDELKALWSQDELSMDFDESMDAYDVGDIVGGVDNVTGVAVASTITKKIVTIQNGKISIDLSTDSVSSSGSGSTGDGSASNDSGALDDETIAYLKLLMWPIGSVYVSETNTSPAGVLGGEWELVDKLLKHASYNQNSGVISINTTNVESLSSSLITVDGNTVEIYITFTTKVALGDTTVELFTINLEDIGIETLASKRMVGFNDAGNGLINASVSSAGVVQSLDVVTKTSGGQITADTGVQFSTTWKVSPGNRLDAFCNRFFWKRIA